MKNEQRLGDLPLLCDDVRFSDAGLSVESVGVELGDGPGGRRAALFDGLRSHVVVQDQPERRLAAKEFSIAVWVRAEGLYGDILGKFDTDRRCGFVLRVGGSSPGYNSVNDARNVHFGIDSDVLGTWEAHGKPWPSNTLISALTVYRGALYAGIADASRFRFCGGSDWAFCGRLHVDPRTRSVMSMLVHDGALYAGSGTWDWVKAIGGDSGPNHVFRYEGGERWHDCGQVGDGRRVLSLASFDGKLYVGDDRTKVYRFDGDGRWSFCGKLGAHRNVNAMMVFQDRLYAATHGAIYRYEGGSEWACVGGTGGPGDSLLYGQDQTHTLQVYQSHLWAGMWPHGKVLRYEGGTQWADCGQLGISTDEYTINEVNDLTVYNGKMYAGAIPLGEVYRYESDGQWTRLGRLVHNEQMDPEDVYSWNRVPCMAVFRGRLFAGTSTCHGIASDQPHRDVGRVFSIEAGRNATFDDDLGTAWRHVAAVRDTAELRLYVDGKPVGRSSSFAPADFDLADARPLLIGLGPQSHFRGALSDLRLYSRALDDAEIARLAHLGT